MKEDFSYLVMMKNGKRLVFKHCQNATWEVEPKVVEIIKSSGRKIIINADEVLAVGNIDDFGMINFEGETNE